MQREAGKQREKERERERVIIDRGEHKGQNERKSGKEIREKGQKGVQGDEKLDLGGNIKSTRLKLDKRERVIW